MTLVALVDACRCLGIDAKTLRRWLQEAHLPLLTHPQDARKKALSQEHLDLLARSHQRALALPTEPLSPPSSPVAPTFPEALLVLPEALAALQAQISALHQQVAHLSALLERHAPALARSPSLPQQNRSRTHSRPSASPRTRRPAAKAPAKPVHIIPRVEYGQQGRYVITCPTRGQLPFVPDSPQWFAWVKTQSSFRFVGKEGHFTAHHEWTTPRGAWRAHRQIRNRSSNLRLAPNRQLTIAILEQAARTLHAHLA